METPSNRTPPTSSMGQHNPMVERILMDIRESRPLIAETRCVKVNLPATLCVRLHAHKLFTGETLGETIERALERFFRTEDAAGPR